MKFFELEVSDQEGGNVGRLTVKARSLESATAIAVNKGFRVIGAKETVANESAVHADAEYDRMKRAVFVGTIQAHFVLFGLIVLVGIVISAISTS